MNYYPRKSIRIAYLLWLLSGFGWLGLHRIYMDKHRTCLLWTLTFGLFGVGAVIDLFTLHRLVQRYNLIQQRRALAQQKVLLEKKKAKLIAEERYKEAALCCDREVEVVRQMKTLQVALKAKPVWPLEVKTLKVQEH